MAPFSFIKGTRLAFARNSGQPASCPEPPDEYVTTRNGVACPFYTIDFAELENGSWTIIEAGDGQVSDDPGRCDVSMPEAIRFLGTFVDRGHRLNVPT